MMGRVQQFIMIQKIYLLMFTIFHMVEFNLYTLLVTLTAIKKPTYSDESAKPGTADMLGYIVFSVFLNPDNELECQSTIDFMDEVVHQNDPCFLSLLSNMRNATVTEQDPVLLLSRCLDKLPSNKITGFDNTLLLVPT
jgi:hypothetical protein